MNIYKKATEKDLLFPGEESSDHQLVRKLLLPVPNHGVGPGGHPRASGPKAGTLPGVPALALEPRPSPGPITCQQAVCTNHQETPWVCAWCPHSQALPWRVREARSLPLGTRNQGTGSRGEKRDSGQRVGKGQLLGHMQTQPARPTRRTIDGLERAEERKKGRKR